jgi:hypothetical protein
MDVYEIRRLNARVLSAEAGGLIEFGARLERAQSLVSRWIGKTKNPKNIGNNAARQIEAVFRKPAGWLDQEHQQLWEEHGFIHPSQHQREKGPIPSERALRIAQIIDEAPPEKVQAILLLLGASEKDIRRLSQRSATPHTIQEGAIPETGERRSGEERRQKVKAVDFDRRSGLDRRASQPFFDDPEIQKKYGKPKRKTDKNRRRKNNKGNPD